MVNVGQNIAGQYDINTLFTATSQPDWKFTAKTTLSEKIFRIANTIIFGFAIYSLYPLVTRSATWIHYTAIVLALRKVVSVVLGYAAFPALFYNSSVTRELVQVSNLQRDGYLLRHVSLEKSGARYTGLIITHASVKDNGNWVINALGNAQVPENHIEELARENFSRNCSTLLINPTKIPTRYELGASFEAGLQFLEKQRVINHIILKGFSIGSGMISEAIQQHDFAEGKSRGIRYLVISDRAFSYLSQVAAKLITIFAKVAFFLSGMDLNVIEGSKKLAHERIQEIVIQNTSSNPMGTDGVIPNDCSLAYQLRKQNLLNHKVIVESTQIEHNSALPQSIEDSVESHIRAFLAT